MTQERKAQFEFIGLMASMMSIVALTIDAILPGVNAIGKSLNHTDHTDLQMIITMIFLGLGIGQLIFGTLSDSFGRKPVVYAGMILFITASLICINATSLEMMLIGRVLQGVGLSAPRSVSTSIIRDLYSGDYMARIMSFITVIFILVPMVAPMTGQLILNYYDWQSIFYFQMMFGIIVVVWFALRQKETLLPENKRKLTPSVLFSGLKEFFKHKESIVYTLISGLATGGFMVFLSSSKQFFQEQYGQAESFVYIFAGLAFFMGLATFLNGSLVLRYGMKRLAHTALIVFTSLALIYILFFLNSGNPKLPVLLTFMAMEFVCIGFIFGNVRAITMQPIGHIAGIGASFSGFVSTIMAVPIAMLIGSFIDTTVLPMFVGFFSCGLVALTLVFFVRRKR